MEVDLAIHEVLNQWTEHTESTDEAIKDLETTLETEEF